jgi:hypothetical protein
MEVITKSKIEEVIIKLTPRDFASAEAVEAFDKRMCALVNDLVPKNIKEQLDKKVNDAPFEVEDKSDANRKHGLYYNVVFDHVNWNQAQQLQTMAKKAGIHFGKIERE